MTTNVFTRKLDSMGRIMIPIRLRERFNLTSGQTYTLETRKIDGHNYICIDCGVDTELEDAMKAVQNAGFKIESDSEPLAART